VDPAACPAYAAAWPPALWCPTAAGTRSPALDPATAMVAVATFWWLGSAVSVAVT
jgi:hypothetical protein